MKGIRTLSAWTILLACSGAASAGTEKWNDPAAAHGIAMGCSTPGRVLQLQRSATSTRVLQIDRSGETWRATLPPMRDKHDSFYLSTYGDAAVVVTSLKDGEAFLVSPGADKIPIDEGYVQEVHFEGNRALVATTVMDGGQALQSRRVRVYDVRSGKLLADRRIADMAPDDMRPLERQWNVKLTLDGLALYYVRSPPADASSIALMDVATGRVQAITLRTADGKAVDATDAVFPTQERGFVAADIHGVFQADRAGLRSLAAPAEVGGVYYLDYSPRLRQLVAIGNNGWALYGLSQGRWSTAEVVGYVSDVRATQDGWSVLDRSVRRDELRIFDTRSGAPKLSRIAQNATGDGIVCLNSHGVMQSRASSLHWQPADPPSH